jgi:TonB family protein
METFFNLNRAYLVASALLSFFIPLVHYEWISKLFITQRVQQTISVYAHPISVYRHQFIPIEQQQVTIGNLIFLVYTTGILFLIIRLIGQIISLRRIINQPDTSSAFSFFKSIRLDPNTENREIIEAHEQVHVRQWHSADVLLIEVIAIICWFNPIVYIYKKGIRHIHEFIADRKAVSSGTTKTEYALMLLSETLKAPAHDLVNTFFNNSLLKRRILMLQKSRSASMALLKYGLSVPLFILMLILSSATIIKSHTIRFFNDKAQEVLASPATQLAVRGAGTGAAAVKTASSSAGEFHGENLTTRSQTPDKLHGDRLFVSVEREPQFKGGMLSFYQFLAANLQYPPQMMRYNIQGKVIITLTIEKDGSVSDVKSIRDVGYGSAEEAIRVLKKSPRWIPGYQNGEPVRVRYTLPISFDLIKEKNNSDTISKVSFNMQNNSALQPQAVSADGHTDTLRKFSMVSGGQFDFMSDALYLLDGKVIHGINDVNANNVKSIRVIKHPDKDNVYVLLYGDRALNGVVLIESKETDNKPAK